MQRHVFSAIFILFLASVSIADVTMTYPAHSAMKDGASVQAGFVGPGQTFDLVFSDDSGMGFDWDTIGVSAGSLPFGWRIVSTQRTDTSLVASIRAPSGAQPNVYLINVTLSSSSSPLSAESVSVRLVVKNGLVDVSFARKSGGGSQYVGTKVLYTAKIMNSSISPADVTITSTLPSNWFSAKSVQAKPSTPEDIELVVEPLASGKRQFAFQAFAGEDNVIVQSYSSELDVRPTMKGKFGAALSGFPFFTFTLLPFQLLDSFLSLVFP